MKEHLVEPGARVHLDRIDPADTSGIGGSERKARAESARTVQSLDRLQELLYADHSHAVLVVLQGMDAGGKDGTIRHVFEGVNPQGVRVACFKQPTPLELAHDFLWRIHAALPARGEMVIFNRSHYEDVLVTRVHKLIPKREVRRRFDIINGFERSLAREGTAIVKFFLHLSPEEQIRRLQARLDDPKKHWKFSASDLAERALWPKYERAYEDMLEHTSTDWAPWHIVPADLKWYRNWYIGRELVALLEGLDLKLPGLSDSARAYLKQERWARRRLPGTLGPGPAAR
jgi:PPK2 family polyphosphate:nucleotide phosphotransferase